MDVRVRARVHGHRQLAAQGYGTLFDQLRDVLYSCDPLNLGSGAVNRDEYGSPVVTIIPRLGCCTTPEQLRFVVEDEMRKHYPACDFAGADWERITFDFWNRWATFNEAKP